MILTLNRSYELCYLRHILSLFIAACLSVLELGRYSPVHHKFSSLMYNMFFFSQAFVFCRLHITFSGSMLTGLSKYRYVNFTIMLAWLQKDTNRTRTESDDDTKGVLALFFLPLQAHLHVQFCYSISQGHKNNDSVYPSHCFLGASL